MRVTGRVLQDAAAKVLQRPGIGLHRPLRIGVAAKAQMNAAGSIVAGQRHELAYALRVEIVDLIAQSPAHLGHALVVAQMLVGGGEDHPLAAIFGGIAEQLVHQRPQALFLVEQRAVIVRGAAAVAARGLPADHALVEHQDVDPGARQPPGGAEGR